MWTERKQEIKRKLGRNMDKKKTGTKKEHGQKENGN